MTKEGRIGGDCRQLLDSTSLSSGGSENGRATGLFSSAKNNRLRTGADKGNPTV